MARWRPPVAFLPWPPTGLPAIKRKAALSPRHFG
jgi:hypothetical protein